MRKGGVLIFLPATVQTPWQTSGSAQGAHSAHPALRQCWLTSQCRDRRSAETAAGVRRNAEDGGRRADVQPRKTCQHPRPATPSMADLLRRPCLLCCSSGPRKERLYPEPTKKFIMFLLQSSGCIIHSVLTLIWLQISKIKIMSFKDYGSKSVSYLETLPEWVSSSVYAQR